MEYIIEKNNEIPVINKSDVAIVGGGMSGFIAALASSRAGLDTILVEQYGFLGGNATMGLPIFGFTDNNGSFVVRGLAEEFINRLRLIGGASDLVQCALHNGFFCG